MELDTNNVIVIESTVSGFRWKDKFPKGTDYNFIAKSKWTAKGVRKVLPEDTAKQEEKVKYARQVAELFLKALADHNIDSTYNLATANYTGGGNYSDTLSKSLYPRPDFAPISDELKFKSFKVQSASLSPDGKEVLCNGTLEGDHRLTEFVMIVVPTNPSGWRVDRFSVTHKKLLSPKLDKNEK